VHHVHHLSSRIPYYRLGQVIREQPALRSAGRLTLWESRSCLGLALWDETRRRLISFRQMRDDAPDRRAPLAGPGAAVHT